MALAIIEHFEIPHPFLITAGTIVTPTNKINRADTEYTKGAGQLASRSPQCNTL